MATSVRRVRRVIRKFDPWTVLKVSFVLYAVLALAFVLGMVIFWTFLSAAEIPQKIESIISKVGLFQDTTIIPASEQLLRFVVFLGVAMTVLLSGLTTLGAVLYNLISDVVGGVEVILLEETADSDVPAVQDVRAVQSWHPAPDGGIEDRAVEDVPTEETATV